MTFVDEVKNAVTPRAALLVIGVLGLQLLFITSYVGALHKPKPTDVAFGVVAPQQMSQQLVDRLDELPGGPLDPRTVSSAAEAREQIMNRDIDGALIVSPEGRTDTLLVASGGGTALATSLERILTEVDASQQRSVRTVDVAPASGEDFNGLSSFYLVVGWCVGGYLCASILAISSRRQARQPAAGGDPDRSHGPLLDRGRHRRRDHHRPGPRRTARQLLGTGLPGRPGRLRGRHDHARAAGPHRHRRHRPGRPRHRHRGQPERGRRLPTADAPGLLAGDRPGPPPGAGTWVARSIAYFQGNAVTGPLLVLSAWAVVGTALTLLLSMRHRADTDPAGAAVTGTTATGAAPGPGVGGSTAA